MQPITRRNALTASLASGAALIAPLARADEPPAATGKPAKDRESAVTFTLKNVVIEEVDEANSTITARFGKKEKPTKLVHLPVGKETRVVASHVFPSVGNHLPFEWEQLRRVKGKEVSLKLRVEKDERQAATPGPGRPPGAELSILSVSVGND